MRTAAQIPFKSAVDVPVDLCKTQSPVRSFQAIEMHREFRAHASAHAENVAPVSTGWLASMSSPVGMPWQDTWNLTLDCPEKPISTPPSPTTQHSEAADGCTPEVLREVRPPVGCGGCVTLLEGADKRIELGDTENLVGADLVVEIPRVEVEDDLGSEDAVCLDVTEVTICLVILVVGVVDLSTFVEIRVTADPVRTEETIEEEIRRDVLAVVVLVIRIVGVLMTVELGRCEVARLALALDEPVF